MHRVKALFFNQQSTPEVRSPVYHMDDFDMVVGLEMVAKPYRVTVAPILEETKAEIEMQCLLKLQAIGVAMQSPQLVELPRLLLQMFEVQQRLTGKRMLENRWPRQRNLEFQEHSAPRAMFS